MDVMTTARTINLEDGRLLEIHAMDRSRDDVLTVVWHHGSPHTGALIESLVRPAARRHIRLVAYARPSYGRSTPLRGRVTAAAASDVAALAEVLELDRFAVMGASGGGPHALACAALLPDRLIAAATFASPAPYTDAFDWFAGMASPDALRSALAGRDARVRHAETETFDEAVFTAGDWAALAADWAPLGQDAGAAESAGPDGLIDDDVALITPWGFDLRAIRAPALIVQGGEDRMIPASHADALLRAIPTAELWLRPRHGHVSVLGGYPVALDWLLEASRSSVS